MDENKKWQAENIFYFTIAQLNHWLCDQWIQLINTMVLTHLAFTHPPHQIPVGKVFRNGP